MVSSIPVTLEGSNLGERHQHYNAMVQSAFQQKIELTSVLQIDEKTPIDRIFKIDLASKYRDVDFILHNLRDDDMLYVSQALKCRWLLEPQHRDVINPRHLEEEIFPHMIQPAINKMRHWLQINLTDTTRCQEFYEYYKDQHQIAVKFLWHCSPDYILAEMLKVLDKLSPQDLKIICETCPQAAQVYLDGLHTNKAALSRYLENEVLYFKSLQCVLKLNASLYLDILEKYFNISKFKTISPPATRYIVKNHKDRFEAKPELYAAYILDLKTLANLLTTEEAKDLVLRLAKAEYLRSIFSYQKVEPFIKRLSRDERATFKKKIFVEKAIGDSIKDWQYPIPITFELDTPDNGNIFLDKEHRPKEYEFPDSPSFGIYKKCCRMSYACAQSCIRKTPLDLLFDRYRFKGFENTFQELRNKLLIESTIEGRMNILLVLVSKSGGVPEQVEKLLKLLTTKHINEPCNLRAAVVRSLVKRASVWRLPADSWTMFLEFGRDLGLEGNQAELVCREGLHAVVLRQLINALPLSTTLKTAFLNEISLLKEYKLTSEERKLVGPGLGEIFLDSKPDFFPNMLAEYKLKIDDFPDAEMTLVQKARTDSELTRRLYESSIGRRYLLKESFRFINNNESFKNALKHDTSVLEKGKSFSSLVSDKRPCHDGFLQSLVLYFNEPDGLADQHKAGLVNAMKITPRPWFARTVNILTTNASYLDTLKVLADMDIKETSKKHLATAFRATAHKCRPMLDIMRVDWRLLGVKILANRALVCREKDRDSYIELLLQCKKTARIAIRLGFVSKSSTETFIRASKLRPVSALKIASKTYLKNNTLDPIIWEVIRKLIENVNPEKNRYHILADLRCKQGIPENIQSEYWQVIYKVFMKIDKRKAMPVLCRIENIQPSVSSDLIRNVLDTFLNEDLSHDRFTINANVYEKDRCLYIRILVKHLLICTSKAEQEERLANICDVFFDKIELIKGTLKENEDLCKLHEFLLEFVRALKYNKVFLGNYISSLPVFERVLLRMKRILPVEQHFGIYVEIHLIMLYYRSLKESIKQKPNVFENREQNLEEAIETVGLQLGQNIGLEVKELTAEYYFSVIDIYKKVLIHYLDDFDRCYGNNTVIVPVLKGLLMFGHTESLLLAHYVLKKRQYNIPDSCGKELLKDLMSSNNEIINFFLCANN